MPFRFYNIRFIRKHFFSILRGITFLLTQWDAYVNSILQCVLDIYDGCTADCQIFVDGLSACVTKWRSESFCCWGQRVCTLDMFSWYFSWPARNTLSIFFHQQPFDNYYMTLFIQLALDWIGFTISGTGVANAVRIVVQPNHAFPDMRPLINILNDACQIFVDGLSLCFQMTKCVCLLGVREYVLHSCSLGILDALGLSSTSHTEPSISSAPCSLLITFFWLLVPHSTIQLSIPR